MQTLESPVSLSLKNILLATDFSKGSEIALNYAQATAAHHHAHVHTLHVAAPDSYQLLDPEAFAITFNGWNVSPGNEIDVLRTLMGGLPNEVPLRPGSVWEVAKEIVRRNEIDLVVLNSHGRQGIPRLLLGSVAEDVLRNVSCPVLVVGPDVKPCAARDLGIKHVLLATHFEPDSAAPGFAKSLCNDFHAELTVVHVVDDHAPTGNTAELEARLNAEFSRNKDLWCEPDFVVTHGVPAIKILDTARQFRADLIVLGARHPEAARINSHLPWATAARVIAEAPCPVLTVRQGGPDADF